MTYFIGRHAVFSGDLYVVTKVPRPGGIKVDNARLAEDWRTETIPAHLFWQARKWSTRAAAEKALAIVHNAGWDDYAIMERNDI